MSEACVNVKIMIPRVAYEFNIHLIKKIHFRSHEN